jgi:UPF0271 protein
LKGIDINCDLGESFGRFKVGYDAEIMPFITSANVACGFHAGDPNIMSMTVKLAKKFGVAVGAHPGYPDLMGFGRRHMALSKEEIKNIILYQVGALKAFTKSNGIKLQHVKPHGALYNMVAKDRDYSDAVIEALKALDPKLILFVLAGSDWARRAVDSGFKVACEVFADRAYNSDGSLVPRDMRGAVITDPKLASDRAIKIVTEKKVEAVDGTRVEFEDVHTICVHGDTKHAVELAKVLNSAFTSAGIKPVPVNKLV